MNYLGAEQTTFTLNFSRGAFHVVSQYYRLISLGKKGYRRVMLDLIRMADYLCSKLEEMGCFVLLSKKRGLGLPLAAFRLDPAGDFAFDEFAVALELRRRGGWMVPAYTMAPHGERVNVLRVVVRQDLSVSRCDGFVADLRMAVQRLKEMSVACVSQS
jgi:glutamate decarboxylase